MIIQYVYHSWQMKEQRFGIRFSVYLEKTDKLFIL